MKSLMVMAVAALCSVAFAEGPEACDAPKGEAPAERAGMQNGPKRGGMRNRGMGMHTGAMQAGGMTDPILRMVSNPKAAEKLGLTDEQKTKLKELMSEEGANKETQKKVREATMKQFELMKADKVDEAAIMGAIDEVFELRKQMAKGQVKRLIAMKSILTPEQIAKAHEEMKSRFQQRGDRGPRRGGMQGGRRGGQKAGLQQGAPEGADAAAPAPEAE